MLTSVSIAVPFLLDNLFLTPSASVWTDAKTRVKCGLLVIPESNLSEPELRAQQISSYFPRGGKREVSEVLLDYGADPGRGFFSFSSS